MSQALHTDYVCVEKLSSGIQHFLQTLIIRDCYYVKSILTPSKYPHLMHFFRNIAKVNFWVDDEVTKVNHALTTRPNRFYSYVKLYETLLVCQENKVPNLITNSCDG